jgi:glycerate kinase
MTPVLVAPDSMGGWLSAVDYCMLAERELSALGSLEVAVHPLADGGEGTAEVLRHHLRPRTLQHRVSGPLGELRDVEALSLPGGIFLESAQAMGLPAGHGSGDPAHASSRGLGEWMRLHGNDHMVIGLGGSSTVDGGVGLLRGLGLEVVDLSGEPIRSGALGLLDAARIEGVIPFSSKVEVWCDVRTPVSECVERFGPQKGLKASMLAPVNEAMMRWAEILISYAHSQGRDGLSASLPGGGAAGGAALALTAALGAELCPGFDAIARLTSLEGELERASWVICGEGRLDMGSFDGKPLGEITRLARRHQCGVIALVGRAEDVQSPPDGPDIVIELGQSLSPSEAMRVAIARLSKTMGW